MKRIKLKEKLLKNIFKADELEKINTTIDVYFEIKDQKLKLNINNEEIIFTLIYDRNFSWHLVGNDIYTNDISIFNKDYLPYNEDYWQRLIMMLLTQALRTNRRKVKI